MCDRYLCDNAALEFALKVRDALTAAGWPEPVYADSGNGAHLLYRVDLPADDGGLIERCLKALAARFAGANTRIGVDISVFNPARIWKLYGTVAGKGDNTLDRPHRLAKLLDAPAQMDVVQMTLLEALAASVPSETTSTPAASKTGSNGHFNLDDWSRGQNLNVRAPEPYKGGRKWVFKVCPWNSDHTNESAFITQSSSGGIGAGCHHAGCSGKSWHDLRDKFEPDRKERQNISSSTPRVIETPSKPAKTEVSMTIREVLDFKAYPTDVFPEPIRGIIRAGCAALNVDESFVGTAMLPVIASAIGNLAVIELKPGWIENSTLWAAFVGDSGTLKSPTLDIVMKHIRTRQGAFTTTNHKRIIIMYATLTFNRLKIHDSLDSAIWYANKWNELNVDDAARLFAQTTIHDGFALEEVTNINAIPNKHDVETAQILLKRMSKEKWVKQCAKEAEAASKPKRMKRTVKRK